LKLPQDPFVLELLPEFVDTWIQDIDDQFKPLIDSKNSDDLYRFGHTIKGSCFQFGLDEIAEKGIELMSFAKTQDWDNAISKGTDIRKSFIAAKSTIEEKLNNK
jgi:hypothetical protein